MTDRELNEMIDWCRKKISNLLHNYSGKRKEGYEDAMLQVYYSKSDAIDCINATSAADVQEVKHAKFAIVSGGKGVCSNCHRLDSIDELAKYCRYCGAKMD